ncbi:hypothetical protein ABKS89_21885 [Pseudomonas sp. LABIM340]|uniref:hypothetical protein n=1 Tax=Pseudomonas sp. LABIM340 TaxID=3156585 RepID=UPI0032AF1C37
MVEAQTATLRGWPYYIAFAEKRKRSLAFKISRINLANEGALITQCGEEDNGGNETDLPVG